MSKLDLNSQVQGVLPLLRGGNANTNGYANELVVAEFVNDSLGTLALGTIVTRTAANPKLHATTATGEKIVGVVVGRYSPTTGLFEATAPTADQTAAVCIMGRCVVKTGSAAIRGTYLRSGSSGQADVNSTPVAGTFGYVLYEIDSGNAQAIIGQIESNPTAISYATPAIVLGTAAAAGAAATVIRSDSTIVAFDATAPVTQAIGDSAATGSAAIAARRDHKHGIPGFGTPSDQSFGDSASTGSASTVNHSDHKHGMPANPTHEILIVDTGASTPLVFADLLQNEAQDDLVYAD